MIGDDGTCFDVLHAASCADGPYALMFASHRIMVFRLPGAYAAYGVYAQRRQTVPGDPFQVMIHLTNDDAAREAQEMAAFARDLARAPLN